MSVSTRQIVAWIVSLLLISGLSSLMAAQNAEPTYQVQSEVEVTGTVARLSVHFGQRGTPRSRATLTLADGGSVEIHIGPSSFVKDMHMELVVGDRVAVIGSRVLSDGSPLVIVRRISRGVQVLELRNAEGRPLWDDRYR